MPINYNIADRATYLTVLKDGSGNYKGVGLMPVDDRNLVVVADDLTRGLMAYGQAIAGRSSGSANPTEPQIVVDGVVARVATEVVDGNTTYWLTFTEKPGTVFSATSRLGPQVALTRPGDTLHVNGPGSGGRRADGHRLGQPGGPAGCCQVDGPSVRAGRNTRGS